MESKGYEGSSLGLARFYRKWIDILFIDDADKREQAAIEQVGIHAIPTEIIMKDTGDPIRLAQELLDVHLKQGRYRR